MIRERILERLTSAEEPRLNAGLTPSAIVIRSIVVHLSGLFNTRRGTVPIDEQYGMPDLSNIAGSFAVGYSDMIEQEILEQIRQYETRLINPGITKLEELKEIITLKYELTAFLQTQAHDSQRLNLFLRINSAGRIAVEVNRGT